VRCAVYVSKSANTGFPQKSAKLEGDFTMAAYVISGRSHSAPVWRVGVTACLVLLGLGMAGCGKLGMGDSGDPMSWARAALERNKGLEVVAADPQASTFTVRIKDTGELRMIRLDEVVGGPPGAGTSAPATSPAATTAASSAPVSSEAAAASASASAAPASAGPAIASTNGSPASETEPGNPGGMREGADRPATASKDVARTGFQPGPAPAAHAPNPNSDVASTTPGGRTLESGPGYVIKTASKAAASARVDRQRSLTTSAAVERRHDPIICQGDRLMQIDNRNLEFDGDAVSAEDGCEIHITNSHISAKGVGVSARAANVHIDNSQIEGDTASVDASNGAQVYASSSRFKGISRRLDNSSFHDLGGNVWN
jgi:hypothetical protein